MKKRVFVVLLALIMVLTPLCGGIQALAQSSWITVRLHYARPDGQYEGWQLWSWDPNGADVYDASGAVNTGIPFYYEEGTDEVVFTVKVKTGTTKIGYIFRYGEWEAKDVEHDQFVNLTGILSGTVDFYVTSGVPTQPDANVTPSVEELVASGHMVLGDDVVEGVVVTSGIYDPSNNDGDPEIRVVMSSKLDYIIDLDTFTVYNSDGEVPIVAARVANLSYYLVLGQELDLTRSYFVSFEGQEYEVTMPDFYSSAGFESAYTYTGDDLGQTYTKEATTLRVWSPLAQAVQVNLYHSGDPAQEQAPYQVVPMTQDVQGTWTATLEGDMDGVYYTYSVTTDTDVKEACDPYARATGVNGDRAMIIDLDATDPAGWDTDTNPFEGGYTDAVLYELHVRDASMDDSSGVSDELKGTYLGLIQSGTKTSAGTATVLDHMVDLGVTHVHLLPVYDFATVDESKMDDDTVNHFNWGYDPKNYNVPEGSYSTDPYNGEVRVREFKQMVQGLHEAGLAVVMDVVYNHVYSSSNFCFNKIVDGYFSRPNSNGSGCGNDTASERAMVRKYIIDSINYWVEEYHIDGFRFDLVGLLDTQTVNDIVESVHAEHPDVIFYGEGWTMSTSWTKEDIIGATQVNSKKTPGFAYFSDTIRNAVKGGTYGGVSKGFISGASSNTAELYACYKGLPSWCSSPAQSVNYISCHDNNTLFDHISMVAGDTTQEQKIAMNKLGAAFYMTSQGIPFFQAGEEFLRSKPNGDGTYNENSYNAGDQINSLKWSDLDDPAYQDVYQYYKGLIAFRKAHPALRMSNAAQVNSTVFQLTGMAANVVGYQIMPGANGEEESIVSIFNANRASATVTLPEGNWAVYINGETAGTQVLQVVTGQVTVEALSPLVLVSTDAPVSDTQAPGDDTTNDPGGDTAQDSLNWALIVGIVLGAIVLIALAVFAFKKK